MKTPEEIKKALECCAGKMPCKECPYYTECAGYKSGKSKNRDALAYIRDLEAAHRTEYCENADYDCVELGKARKRIAELEAQVETLKAQMED